MQNILPAALHKMDAVNRARRLTGRNDDIDRGQTDPMPSKLPASTHAADIGTASLRKHTLPVAIDSNGGSAMSTHQRSVEMETPTPPAVRSTASPPSAINAGNTFSNGSARASGNGNSSTADNVSSSISNISTGTGIRNSGGPRRRIFSVSGSLVFRADFDGGNLAGARLHTAPRSPSDIPLYELSVAPDCQGTKCEAPYKLWYHFCIQGGQAGRTIRMRIVDLHPICKVYNRDMRPLVRVVQHSPTWER